MAVLFTPQRIGFAATILAGAGFVNQATYTCPAGKRAIFDGCWLQMNANTATAGTGFLRCRVGTLDVASCLNLNALGTSISFAAFYDLAAGETVILITGGGAAASIGMNGSAFIREYN